MSRSIDPYASAKMQPVSHGKYRWKVVYTDPRTGKRREKYSRTKAGCIEWIDGEYTTLLEAANKLTTSSMTFKEAFAFYRETGRTTGLNGRDPMAQATVNRLGTYEKHYLAGWDFYHMPIDRTPDRACFDFMRDIAKQRKYSASKAAQALKASTAFARQERKCSTDPFKDTKTPPASSSDKDKSPVNKSIPTTEQVRTLFDTIRDKEETACRQDTKRQWRSILVMSYLAATAGLRSGEFVCLRRENIDLVAKKVRIVEAVEAGTRDKIKKPKSAAGIRAVPLSDATIKVLTDYFEEYDIPTTGRIFSTRTGTLYARSNLQRAFRELRDDVDMPEIGFHGLRHYFASRMIQKKVDPKTLTYLLGHEDYAFTLNVYGHLLEDSITPDLAITL